MRGDALDRIHVPLRVACAMVGRYVRGRLFEQVRSTAFIIIYLVAFQMVVLGTVPSQAWTVAAGIGLVILGLTLFLEGLLLGLMPLGEQVGLQLPRHGGLSAIVFFAMLLGVGSTLAEPALASLRAAGSSVTPWEAPLLFRLLEMETGLLVISIGAGVGMAVVFGMIRFYQGFSIKPYIYLLLPPLLLATLFCWRDANLASIIGLAWDAGAVTTGPVTVPLVLALGIGVSRAMGKAESASASFGAIMLASAFPELSVMALGAWLNPSTPAPVNETDFFAPAYREQALSLVGTEEALRRMVFQRGSEAGRQAFYVEEAAYLQAVRSLKEPEARRALLGEMSLWDWMVQRASSREHSLVPANVRHSAPDEVAKRSEIPAVLGGETLLAVRAVLPLTALLLVVLLLFLRESPRYPDEVLLGIVLAFAGMALLTSGIRLGLAPLGDQVGRPLPRVFSSVAHEEGRMLLEPFDRGSLLTSYAEDGSSRQFFYLDDQRGVPQAVAFDPRHYDPGTGRYEHVIERPPLFGPRLTLVGIALVFVFAFGLGYGATLAEPALRALGRTVEELTVGVVKSSGLVRAVSVGVGMGLMAGVARILYDVPMVWMVLVPYVALIPLTYWSQEDFAGIAWDCGGVTTGVVTVPLVLAMGLGIGGEMNRVDGFGVLAMASVYPIVVVLLYGLFARARQRCCLAAAEEGGDDE